MRRRMKKEHRRIIPVAAAGAVRGKWTMSKPRRQRPGIEVRRSKRFACGLLGRGREGRGKRR